MPDQFTILTVCTGNICRSPLAQLLLAQAFAGFPVVRVASMGTRAIVGAGMPPHSLAIAHRYGVQSPEDHVSTQMTAGELQTGDLILAMSREHARLVAEMNPRISTKIFTVREFARLADATTDTDLMMEFKAVRPDSAVTKLRTGVTCVGLGRGTTQSPADPALDDVVDPYGHGQGVYERSANELIPAVNSTVSILHRALSLES
ncbi:low molecular weight phosphatase family protein [Jonesiaceae bacterium BS-20]|uniref:protein-tyrosine-phosphatase n=1 Tax=Jonesiaceae bacterium BS-20 TaxID=3120821 RepID=A0AAU7DVZ1_9MICO